MNSRFATLALASLIAAAQAQSGLVDAVVWRVADGGNGHRYALTDAPAAWTATEAFAITRGGHLASVNDAAENEFLRQTFFTGAGAGEDRWIGLTCPAPLDYLDRDNWEWTDGTPVAFSNWRGSGQPDLGGGNDRYAAVNFPRTGTMEWDNYPDSSYRLLRGIVEFPSCNSADLGEPFGLLDLADVLAFASAFLDGDLVADFNGDGLLDLGDVVFFVDAFTAGCL